MDYLGYCCINTSLRAQKPSVYSSRGIVRKSFTLNLAAERALLNVRDILEILIWNERNNIKVFRIGSEPLPRSGDMQVGYSITDLPNSSQILSTLNIIGKYVHDHQHHISFHPGQYVCLGSPNDAVRQLGIYALERENEVADALCANYNIDIPINIHIGGSYNGDFEETANRFIASYNSLSPSLQKRLVVENDDKASCWSTKRLYEMIYNRIGIPLTYDFHHHLFCSDGMSSYDAFVLSKSTWGDRNMQVHYSQSPTADKLIPKHSDYYRDALPDWINSFTNFHVHLECKAKELALLKYRQDFGTSIKSAA